MSRSAESKSDDESRRRRQELFAQFDGIESAGDLCRFQEELAAEIIGSEAVAFKDKRAPERFHIRRLRLLGDGLWRSAAASFPA